MSTKNTYETIEEINEFNQKYHAFSAWVGHLPFAYWFVKTFEPKTIVELGSHYAVSYFTFCQSVQENNLDCQCHAVDTWKGEEQAGFYSEEVYDAVKKYNDENYSEFSTLHRCFFEEAVNEFEDGSIDLLHIDGFHSYEAVKNDFETYKNKLSPNAVVLFHDTMEIKEGFGVHQFWDEITKEYPWHVNFPQSHGLGVLSMSDRKTPPHIIFDQSSQKGQILFQYLSVKGEAYYSGFFSEHRRKKIIQMRNRNQKMRGRILNYQKQLSEQSQ